jgi:hypothetical protein
MATFSCTALKAASAAQVNINFWSLDLPKRLGSGSAFKEIVTETLTQGKLASF